MAGILDEIVKNEGGFTHDPDDPGGPTKFGITAATLSEWRGRPVSVADVEGLGETEARTIYAHRYIILPGFNRIPFEPLRNQMIDYGVNAGPRVPITNLQHILGVDRDGILGPETLTALAARDAVDVNNRLVALRELFYRELARNRPRSKKFLNGWLARAHRFYLHDQSA